MSRLEAPVLGSSKGAGWVAVTLDNMVGIDPF